MVDDLDDDEPHPAHDASTNEDKNLETNDSEQEKQKQHVVCPMLGSDVDMICQSTLFLDKTWVYFDKLSDPSFLLHTTSHPSHVLQAQGDGVVAVLGLAVLGVCAAAEDPLVVQVLHQPTCG